MSVAYELKQKRTTGHWQIVNKTFFDYSWVQLEQEPRSSLARRTIV